MRCVWAQERLLLYLAGELSPRETALLLRHLEGCEACTVLAEELAETQARVESSLQTDMEAPATLEASIMKAVREEPARRKPWRVSLPHGGWGWSLQWAAAALCLLVAGFALGSSYARRGLPWGPGEARTLDLALLARIPPHSLGLPFVTPPLASRMLTAQARFPVLAVDLQPEGARLVEAGAAMVQGVPVADLRYEFGGERIVLLQMDAAKLAPPAFHDTVFRSESYLAGKRKGFSYVAWRSGRTNCVMVAPSKVPMHNLFRLACHACEKQDRL